MKNNTLLHWNYYLALEDNLEVLSKYIEFTPDNYKVYSIELTRLLLSSASEFEVVIKEICGELDSNFNKENSKINDYYKIIKLKYNSILDEQVYINRYSILLKPFITWTNKSCPEWWRSYNNVKHQRKANYSEANLENVLNSMAALFVIIFYYYKLNFIKIDPKKYSDNIWVTYRMFPFSKFLRFDNSYYFGIYQENID